jgi:cell wall-associated NlpC family hydrolase
MRRLDVIRIALLLALILQVSCAAARANRSALSDIERNLQNAHSDWAGTPYRIGGTTTAGIDCSAFIQIVMRSYLDVEVPRSTREQMAVGSRVKAAELLPGDLVFFQTGRSRYHVGIYIADGRFLHASTSSGVMISSLNEAYWRRTYLQSRRVR